MKVEIVPGPEKGSFSSTTKRTSIPQGEKLEEIMKNLCASLNIKIIYRILNSRYATFYRPKGSYTYQSATNTILQLSEEVAEKMAD